MEKRIGATILLTLLLVAATTDAIADEVDSSIRLPSDGKGVDSDDNRGPWRCCVRIYCQRRWPGPVTTCQCKDTVKNCQSGCESCEEVDGGKVCNDWYPGEPGDFC